MEQEFAQYTENPSVESNEDNKKKKRRRGCLFSFLAVILLFFFLLGGLITALTAMIGGASSGITGNAYLNTNLSAEVLALEPRVREEAIIQGIEEYVPILLAIMMQESGGDSVNTPDVFQCSESLGLRPNSLNTEESIIQGVKYFAELLKKSKEYGISDIKATVQAYNFGGGFLQYVKDNGKSFTIELAKKYSEIQGGTSGVYGDTDYVAHVFRFITIEEVTTIGSGVLNTVPLVGKPLKFTEGFGQYKDGGDHRGIDLVVADGANVVAAGSGEVVDVRYDTDNFGNFVLIRHQDNLYTGYAHMQAGSIQVRIGQKVNAGDLLGKQGDTGLSFGSHLHFEVRTCQSDDFSCRQDPLKYMDIKFDE